MVIQPSEYLKNCLKIRLDKDISVVIDDKASVVTFEKGYHPIQMGDKVSSFYFIIYGIVRGYYIDDDGKEATKCFSFENGFFGSECFRTNSYSSFYVECIEECKCIKLPYTVIRKIISMDKQVEQYVQNLYLEELGKLESRAKYLLLLSADERYISFCKEYPNLQRRIPLKFIASFIGIKAGSMSRIRKKLKNQI